MDKRKIIGKGAFGTVYVAKIETGEVAVKTIPHIDKIVLFPLELSIMLTYDHPYINKAQGIKYLDDCVEIMQEIATCNLREYIINGNNLTNEMITRWLFQIISAIGTLHHNNIIHSDIKPSNVLVFSDDCIKLTDFGFCMLTTDMLIPKDPLGTLKYSAPEILLSGIWSKPADIWAYGCIGYELLTRVPLAPTQTSKRTTEKQRKFSIRLKTAKAFQNWRIGLGDVMDSKIDNITHIPILYKLSDGILARIILKCCAWHEHDRPTADSILGYTVFKNFQKPVVNVKQNRYNNRADSGCKVDLYLKDRNLQKLDGRIRDEIKSIYYRAKLEMSQEAVIEVCESGESISGTTPDTAKRAQINTIVKCTELILIEASLVIAFRLFHYSIDYFHTLTKMSAVEQMIRSIYILLNFCIHST